MGSSLFFVRKQVGKAVVVGLPPALCATPLINAGGGSVAVGEGTDQVKRNSE